MLKFLLNTLRLKWNKKRDKVISKIVRKTKQVKENLLHKINILSKLAK